VTHSSLASSDVKDDEVGSLANYSNSEIVPVFQTGTFLE
jgi:hypothetical protein